ncbi:MAG: TolC family protein [Prevotellaceae bacterium]|jgi:outer membrane protein TolC|nr:TolC family protein [Prevotellaceae bacterium]
MKKITVSLIAAIIYVSGIQAQNIQSTLEQIEANSATLAAIKKQTEATKAAHRTGIYLPDPEVEFNYLWGSPAATGNRTDLNVMQSFDFPTAYLYKRKIAEGKAAQVDLQYAVERKSLLLQARKICIELVYRNALQAELNKRMQNAESIAAAWQAKFDRGETGILELNKAKLNLLNARTESANSNVEREALLAELVRLNGGKAIVFSDSVYENTSLPADFDEWYANAEAASPALQQLSQELEISRRQVQLNKAQSLPKFSAGYTSERIAGTTLQGIGAGISIPLWENKNTVRAARAQTVALQFAEADAKTQFYSVLKLQYAKARSLQRLADDYRQSLQTVSNADLLLIALESGQISLIEYVMEQTVSYDAVNRMFETERDFQISLAELMQWDAGQ